MESKSSEQQKYEKAWAYDGYRKYAPGEDDAMSFAALTQAKDYHTIIDYGCGTGRGAEKIRALTGAKVIGLDFAPNCLDPEVEIEFVQHDLTEPVTLKGDFGYCTDVMEHLPPESVLKVLWNIVTSSRKVFFRVCCTEDHMGEAIDEELHLTVENYDWWKSKFEELNCTILQSQDRGEICWFYVTAYASGEDLKQAGSLNIGQDVIEQQVLHNSQQGYREVEPHQVQDTEIMVLGGGPSLNEFEDEIRELREGGMPLVTTNGTYNWCLERGITPSVQVVLDAREFNKRFVEPIQPRCKYVICAQVHPSVCEAIPHDQLEIWYGKEFEPLLERPVWGIPGGSTVMLRTIPLLLVLGFTKMRVYGFDSCLMDESHHAYSQPENDQIKAVRVTVDDRQFDCAGWMAVQAHEFVQLMKILPEQLQMAVFGDGLIAHIIKTGAERNGSRRVHVL